MDTLDLLRIASGESADDPDWTDEILLAFLEIAGQAIIARCYPYNDEDKEVPRKYIGLQLRIALYLLNKRGAEGELAHTENGISRTWQNGDIPNSMLSEVVPYVGGLR